MGGEPLIARPPLAWRVPPRPPPPSTTLPISLSPVASQGFRRSVRGSCHQSSPVNGKYPCEIIEHRICFAHHLPAWLLADSTQMDATYLTDAASTRKQAQN